MSEPAAQHRGDGEAVPVTLISLGGTIAMAPSADGGVTPALGAEDLLAAVPELAEVGAALRARSLRNLPSPSLTFTDLAALHAEVESALADGAAGVVVTQGTDTLEETAFFLDLTVRSDAPVVVTGAMRHPGAPGADGPANLLAAVRVAASDRARGLGTLVVISDEVHAARLLRKTHTASTGAFHSPGFGPLGLVVEGEPRLLTTPGPRTTLPVGARVDAVRVAVVPMALGDDGALLYSIDDRFAGLVLAGVGAGHVPERVVPVVAELAKHMPVVLASRAGAGAMLTHTYGYPGSELDLLRRGLIPAGFLDPYKSRVLLQLLLGDGAPPERIRRAFATYR